MKTGLVVGSAACVWKDLVNAHGLGHFDAVAVTNAMGCEYEDPIDYWVTLHPEKMLDWQRKRAERGFPRAKLVVSNDFLPGAREQGVAYPHLDRRADYRFFSDQTSSGSSGLFAVKVLVDEGFERIVLAGVPMQAIERHFDSPDPWNERDVFAKAWTQVLPLIKGAVRSMSGWTQELLGSPTAEWLRGS